VTLANTPEFAERYRLAVMDAATKKSEAVRAEKLAKRVFSACYLSAEGPVAEREHKARTNEEYKRFEDDWIAAEHEANIAEAKVDAMRLAADIWRTSESSRRAEMSLR